jgi:hypothetical protein
MATGELGRGHLEGMDQPINRFHLLKRFHEIRNQAGLVANSQAHSVDTFNVAHLELARYNCYLL